MRPFECNAPSISSRHVASPRPKASDEFTWSEDAFVPGSVPVFFTSIPIPPPDPFELLGGGWREPSRSRLPAVGAESQRGSGRTPRRTRGLLRRSQHVVRRRSAHPGHWCRFPKTPVGVVPGRARKPAQSSASAAGERMHDGGGGPLNRARPLLSDSRSPWPSDYGDVERVILRSRFAGIVGEDDYVAAEA